MSYKKCLISLTGLILLQGGELGERRLIVYSLLCRAYHNLPRCGPAEARDEYATENAFWVPMAMRWLPLIIA